MAIGDAVAQVMGTAATDRQPSSGVEEQISAIVKDTPNDAVRMADSAGQHRIFQASIETSNDFDNAATGRIQAYNMALMITNTVFLRKPGTTDIIVAMGVQTNS
jgi:hypothetical protein